MGSDADLLVWDASASDAVTVKSHSDIDVYDSLTFTGAATHVIHAGHVIVDEDLSLIHISEPTRPY